MSDRRHDDTGSEYEPEPEDWYEANAPALADPDAPIAVYSHRAEWRGEASTRAAELLTEHPAVFHDERDSLVWVKDQRRAVVMPMDADILAGLYIELGVKFNQQAGKVSALVPAPDHLLRRVISGRFPSCKWRLLRGFAEGPHILSDGTIITKPGYNEQTHLWLPASMTVDLPEGRKQGCIAPNGYNQKSAVGAIDWLMSELNEFPWQDPQVDRAVWLAYLFTLISRPAYEEAPFFLFDAPHSGSGKDLLLKCAELVAHGREARRVSFINEPYQDENRIATLINDGYSTGVIGDLRVLDNTLLIALVSEGRTYTLRTLGTQSGMKIPYNLTLAGTGHNVRFKESDMIRRSLRCRLMPDQPNPEERPVTKLNQKQLKQWFVTHRQRALSVCLNTMRGYLHYAAHHPDSLPQGVDCKAFPDWADLVQRAILWTGRADPVASQVKLREAMVVRSGDPVGEFIAAWWKCYRHLPKKAAEFTDLLTQNPDNLTAALFNLRDALKGLSDKPLGPKYFKSLLSEKRDEVFTIEDGTEKRRVRLCIYPYGGSFHYELKAVDR